MAAGLALVGVGVGIGALIWSGDSSTKAAAPTAARNAATAAGKSKGTGNYNEGATIRIVSGIPNPGTTMTLSPGSDTNCTKDETVGEFPVIDGSTKEISMRVRSDLDEGRCFYQSSWHAWKVSLPGGAGELGLFEQRSAEFGAPIKWYEAQCGPHWTGGRSCRDDSNLGRAGDHMFWLTKTS